MRRHFNWVALLFAVGCAPAAPEKPPARAPAAPEVASESPLDSLLPTILERDRIPGAVVLIGDLEGIRYRKAFGAARIDTIFDLASCTKVVGTTTAVMMLVERGKLSLDDPLGKFVKCFEGRAIRIRDLLAHRSRFPAYHTPKTSTPDEILGEFSRLPEQKLNYTYS
jgi:CubicO group peptidase (beta-lactamase class C family)